MTTAKQLDVRQSWAAMPLHGRIDDILRDLETATPVALIAACPILTCSPDETVCEVLNQPELRVFDHIPVRDGRGCIVGVLNRKPQTKPRASVSNAMDELRESMLMSANACLLAFVEQADNREFALVVDGNQITGIVTRSDLQKLAVRPPLFLRITCLELLLARWLRETFPDETRWLNTLSAARQEQIEATWAKRCKNNLAIDKISTTQLEDKCRAAHRLGAFETLPDAKGMLNWAVKLRHSVSHAGDFALTPENANHVAVATRYTKLLIRHLLGVMPIDNRDNVKDNSAAVATD